MRFYFLLFTLSLITIKSFSQNDKPTYYYDENEFQISDSLYFEKVKQNKGEFEFLNLHFEVDTSFFRILVRRKKYGKLKQSEFDSLQKSLVGSTTKSGNKYTVIQYHPGKDQCNSGNAEVRFDKITIFEKGYLKKINKEVGIDKFWVHKEDERIDYDKVKSVKWQADVNRTVENLFFKLPYPCHSFVIVNNYSKNYISFFSEYHSGNIIDCFKELIDGG
ncbi:hypothetical protein [Winogradskyella sp. MH6]|uniref:hypothetical protein n=1 Tax=Winogradskyella sp. MH6 TaxID=2929510 RepID=UPI001FB27BEF|nr:hypothetical protein [Winogradskyella sp. MH6]